MNALAERIARLIEAQGPISVAQYMTIALHDPEAGYYATHDPLGAKGDFITAPEVSQMFGELLGLWCVEAWQQQGAPERINLVELGPGRGTLMADALRASRAAPAFLHAVEIVLVEASPVLRSAQKDRLKDCGRPLRWLSRFDDSVADRPLFLLANEFFDALPIRQFVHAQDGWHERMVAQGADDALIFALAPFAQTGLTGLRGPADDGAVFEIAPAATALAGEIAHIIAQQGGAALFIDYGYGDEASYGETLQAMSQHRYTGILDNPGGADLSGHVDFAALGKAARDSGAIAFGPVDQGDFLRHLGIEIRAQQLAYANPHDAEALHAATQRLTAADAMGNLFKVLAITPPHAPKPPGF